jgi:hypothetical protein
VRDHGPEGWTCANHPAVGAGRPDAPDSSRLTCGTIRATLCGMTTTVEELMKNAVDARRTAQNTLRVAVREAREADWSWDRISAALGGSPNGETLRRNFADDE